MELLHTEKDADEPFCIGISLGYFGLNLFKTWGIKKIFDLNLVKGKSYRQAYQTKSKKK